MAFDILDEHEQGELVRQWLRENAVSIAVGVGLGLALIFGWQQWRVHRVHHNAEAAAQYHAMSAAFDDKRTSDAEKIAAALRKDFPDTSYAVFAAMRQADLASGNGDAKTAATELAWARDHAGVPALKTLAGLRLARVTLAQGDADGALKLLDALPEDDYGALASELRGDALVKLGRTDDARAAYQKALAGIDPQAPDRNFIQMKFDDLAPVKEKQGS
ncbi:MAG TPA: tetratricopeptide repeat protein [Rhodanobacteraceae bacterium]|nr:tetratricopeptide repeat protein [Rhodanobacteraceae bacterium]